MKHMAVLSASTRVRLSRKERGHCRVYLADSIETRRMHASFEKDAAKAERNLQSVLGVKGLSVNFFLFSTSPSSVEDYMCARGFSSTRHACRSTARQHFHSAQEGRLLK